MKRRKIYFRADAGATIGYGHFVRSLALADMLKDDFDCTFFTKSPTDYQKKEAESVCNLVALPSDDSRFDEFLLYLNGDEIVVLDNYFFTSDYQKQIKDQGCKLVCIDDIHDRQFYADVIINHCINDCTSYVAESETAYFLGAKWALLRKPFLQEIRGKHDANHWVVIFGGSDPYNLSLPYALFIKSLIPDARLTIVVGDGYKNIDELGRIDNVTILNKLTADQIKDTFSSAAHVVCSSSSVCYEALACGCTIHAGYYVNNQVEFYQNLKAQGIIDPLENLLNHEPHVNLNYKSNHSNISFSDIANRYRQLFKALTFKIVNYTQMSEDESRKTWECRNLEEIRSCMVNPNPFSFESHCNFIKSLEFNSTRLYYALFDNGTFVSSFDFIDIKDDELAERGLFVNPQYFRQGIGNMMDTYFEGIIVKRGVHKIAAEVYKFNEPSCKYHLHQGFKPYNEDEQLIYLAKTI
jgi:spore coat polysaccharide biosynthesis predicted glycosyltransferase SpsG/RimJ/RimL family protein N-acetyltransferase